MVAAPTFAIVKTAIITASAHVVGKVMAIRLANQKLEESERLVELNIWQSTSTNAFSMIKGSKVKIEQEIMSSKPSIWNSRTTESAMGQLDERLRSRTGKQRPLSRSFALDDDKT